MKKTILALIAVVALHSCKKNENVTTTQSDSTGVFQDEETAADSTLAATTGCYMEATGQDTLFAQIDENLGTVTGKLHYKNFQKDSSFGDISGISSGDTIKIDYTFQSEGTLSTREIWFLKKDGKLIEGIGTYDQSGEKYADNKVKFEDGQALTSVDCNTISGKFPEFSVNSNSAVSAAEPEPQASPKKETAPKPETKKEPQKKETEAPESTKK